MTRADVHLTLWILLVENLSAESQSLTSLNLLKVSFCVIFCRFEVKFSGYIEFVLDGKTQFHHSRKCWVAGNEFLNFYVKDIWQTWENRVHHFHDFYYIIFIWQNFSRVDIQRKILYLRYNSFTIDISSLMVDGWIKSAKEYNVRRHGLNVWFGLDIESSAFQKDSMSVPCLRGVSKHRRSSWLYSVLSHENGQGSK